MSVSPHQRGGACATVGREATAKAAHEPLRMSCGARCQAAGGGVLDVARRHPVTRGDCMAASIDPPVRQPGRRSVDQTLTKITHIERVTAERGCEARRARRRCQRQHAHDALRWKRRGRRVARDTVLDASGPGSVRVRVSCTVAVCTDTFTHPGGCYSYRERIEDSSPLIASLARVTPLSQFGTV